MARLPLAFGTGTGSELRRPLGITIVGGLIVSQMLTLYTTPVVYLFFDRLRLRFRGKQPATLNHGTAEAVLTMIVFGVFVMKKSIMQSRRLFAALFAMPVAAFCAMLAGCNVGPKYLPPAMTAPPAFKESPAQFKEAGGWTVAQPQDAALRGKWWEIYNDPDLNALEDNSISTTRISARPSRTSCKREPWCVRRGLSTSPQ